MGAEQIRPMGTQLLQAEPIEEISISIEPQYVGSVQTYLEGLGCRVTFLSQFRMYHIRLPAGTSEETYAGESTGMMRRTTIRFPNNDTLQKYNKGTKTTLAFPNNILPPPKGG